MDQEITSGQDLQQIFDEREERVQAEMITPWMGNEEVARQLTTIFLSMYVKGGSRRNKDQIANHFQRCLISGWDATAIEEELSRVYQDNPEDNCTIRWWDVIVPKGKDGAEVQDFEAMLEKSQQNRKGK